MKVYLSRSNAADPNLYAKIKSGLLKQTEVGKLIEWHVGTYDKDSILDADVLIIVPPAETLSVHPKCLNSCTYSSYYVGYGQTEQIKHFSTYKPAGHIFAITAFDDSDGQFYMTLVDEAIDLRINRIDSWSRLFVNESNEDADCKLLRDLQEYVNQLAPPEFAAVPKVDPGTFQELPMLGAIALFPVKL